MYVIPTIQQQVQYQPHVQYQQPYVPKHNNYQQY